MSQMRRHKSRRRRALRRKFRRRFGHARHSHTRPGTLIVPPDAKETNLRVTGYGPQQMVDRHDASLTDVAEMVGNYPVTWIDATGLADIELIDAVGKQLGLHPLALEDLVNIPQRSKIEAYPQHLYCVVQMPPLRDQLRASQLSVYLGKDFVLSWRESQSDRFQIVRKRMEVAGGVTRSSGPDYLLYALMDAAIDGYFPLLERFADDLDDFDDRVETSPDAELLSQIHDVRRDVRRLRRVVWPVREAVDSLLRQEDWPITAETRIHLRDCHDHVVQIIDALENIRDACADLRDYYSTSLGNRTNEIMRVLTVIATVFMPLSFIAGLYGMNFDGDASRWNMPELGWRFGYPLVLGLMGAVTLGQLWFFRSKGWLGQRGRRPRSRDS